ncbi:hypothetical protein ACA910_002228 [Epithemia clementina (nom. ined.)]
MHSDHHASSRPIHNRAINNDAQTEEGKEQNQHPSTYGQDNLLHHQHYSESSDLSQLPELQARIRRHVHNFILQSLSMSQPQQSQAYLEAMQQCPALVWNETDPLQFVRRCNYQLAQGAQRLCLYWTERKNLFGPERAYSPLRLGGMGGALEEQDISTLQAACPALLPKTTWGLQCLFLEPKWKMPQTTLENVLRSCFYLVTVMAEDDRSQVEGVHCIYVVSTPRGPAMDWPLFHRFNYFLSHVFPVRMRQLHLVGFPHQKRPSELTDLMTTTTHALQQYYTQEDWSQVVQIHMEHRPKQVWTELVAAGLTTKGIPLVLGGEWTQQDLAEWCNARMRWERSKDDLERAAAVATMSHGDEASIGLLPGPPGIVGGVALPLDRIFLGTGGSASCSFPTMGTHTMFAAHGGGVGGGAASVVADGNNNEALTALARAMTPPPTIESEEEKLARKRMANLISSRRKRERQRQQRQRQLQAHEQDSWRQAEQHRTTTSSTSLSAGGGSEQRQERLLARDSAETRAAEGREDDHESN